MNITMYGIPNCNSIKKARVWLEQSNIPFTFHHYKKEGIDKHTLELWCQYVSWEVLLNKRGTTWRKLSDADKSDLNQEKAINLMITHSSMIKRPVLNINDQHFIVGFDEKNYHNHLRTGENT